MFSHIMVGANNIEESKIFYDKTLVEWSLLTKLKEAIQIITEL